MGTSIDVREELRKLKLIAEHTEEWASKVTSFLVVTQELCKAAAHVFYHLDDDAWEIETVLVDGAETVADAVSHVVELAREKSTEVVNHFQNRSKGSGCDQKELQTKVEQATLAVGMAIFETLQLQAEEFGKLAEKSIGAAKRSASALAPRLSSVERLSIGTPRSLTNLANERGKTFWDDGKSEVTGTDDVDLDWDAFENDLKAITDVVESGLTSAEEAIRTRESAQFAAAEMKALRLKIDELEVEKSSALYRVMQAEQRSEEAFHRAENAERAGCEALQRAEQAEEAVQRLKRERESWRLTQSSHTDDDYQEVQRALKAEQMARLQAEERLRAVEAHARNSREDASAARLALEMTRKMAASLVGEGSSVRHGSEASSMGGLGASGSWDGCGPVRNNSVDDEGAEYDSDAGSQATDVILSKSASQMNLESLSGRQDSREGDERRGFSSRYDEGDPEPHVSSAYGKDRGPEVDGTNPFEAPARLDIRDTRIARSWTSDNGGCMKNSGGLSRPSLPQQGSSDVGARSRDDDSSNPFLCAQGEQTRKEDYVNPFENGARSEAKNESNGSRKSVSMSPSSGDYTNPFEPPVDQSEGKNPFEGPATGGVDKGYKSPFEKDAPLRHAPVDDTNPFLSPEGNDALESGRSGRERQEVARDRNRISDARQLRASSRALPAPKPVRSQHDKSGQPPEEGWNPFTGTQQRPSSRGATWNPFESGADSHREKKPPLSRSSWNPFH